MSMASNKLLHGSDEANLHSLPRIKVFNLLYGILLDGVTTWFTYQMKDLETAEKRRNSDETSKTCQTDIYVERLKH